MGNLAALHHAVAGIIHHRVARVVDGVRTDLVVEPTHPVSQVLEERDVDGELIAGCYSQAPVSRRSILATSR